MCLIYLPNLKEKKQEKKDVLLAPSAYNIGMM